MATNNRTADVLLRYTVDTASVNRVRASFTNLENELDDLRAELTGVGTSAQRGVTALRQRFSEGERAVEGMQNEVEQLRRDLLALDDVKVTPTVDVQQAGGSSRLETVDRFGRFGTQFAGAFGASGSIGNVVGFIGDFADSIATLGPAGGVAAVAIGGVSLALAKFAGDAEATIKRLETLIAGESRAEELIAQGDLDEQRDRRAEIIREVALAEAQLNERQLELLLFLNKLTPARQAEALALADLNIILGEDAATVETYNNAIEEQQQVLLGLSSEFIELNARITEAEAQVTPLADVLGNIIRIAVPAADGLRQIYETLQQGQAFGRGTGKGFSFPTKDVFLADQAAAKAAQEALSGKRTDAYLAAITETVQAQDTLRRAQEAYNEAVNASAARIAEINAKLQADLSQAEVDRQSDLAEAARDAGEERVKVTEDAEKERARIQRRFERTYSDAVAERDALAAKRAEDQRDDELKELDERYKEQLKAVDKSLAQQQRVIEQRYAAQVQTINAAAQSAVRTEQAAAQARLSALQQGVQAAQVALINAQQSEFMIRANYYNQAISQAQVWANLMQLYTSYGFSLPGGTGGSYGGGGGGRVLPTPLAEGGPAYANTPYLVGERGPELFVPAQSGRIIPNGAGMTINVQGAQMDTIRVVSRQQAMTAFGRVLDQMGVA